ncbi:hypothetical protein B0H13DRAFT_2336568 [Mycena leptocephala]|nr:hypothetical protein B0H13DRAFT_2336568 [Mycena leptocephala]
MVITCANVRGGVNPVYYKTRTVPSVSVFAFLKQVRLPAQTAGCNVLLPRPLPQASDAGTGAGSWDGICDEHLHLVEGQATLGDLNNPVVHVPSSFCGLSSRAAHPAVLRYVGTVRAHVRAVAYQRDPAELHIAMAVTSISTQSSIGMGAVKCDVLLPNGHLIEGSIVGSWLAGVLLMPGMSMCSSVLRRQKFNAKSAGVTSAGLTSMVLIMVIIGTSNSYAWDARAGRAQVICCGYATSATVELQAVADRAVLHVDDPLERLFELPACDFFLLALVLAFGVTVASPWTAS